MVYSEATNQSAGVIMEATKCGAALAAVQVMRGKNANLTQSAKFALYDAFYSKFVEPSDSVLFGASLPKLTTYLPTAVSTDPDTQQIELVLQKYLYVIIICWLADKVNLSNMNKSSYWDYALAYGVRHALGVFSDPAPTVTPAPTPPPARRGGAGSGLSADAAGGHS